MLSFEDGLKEARMQCPEGTDPSKSQPSGQSCRGSLSQVVGVRVVTPSVEDSTDGFAPLNVCRGFPVSLQLSQSAHKFGFGVRGPPD